MLTPRINTIRCLNGPYLYLNSAQLPPVPTLETLPDLISWTLSDPRRTSHGNIRHSLSDIVTVAFVSTHCGCKTYEQMEDFAKDHYSWLSNYLDFLNGIPDSDTFRRCLEEIDPDQLSRCLHFWLDVYAKPVSDLSLDGKTIRGSRSETQGARHVLSAFDTANQAVIDQLTIPDKHNEITGSKLMLESMDLEGVTVRADAMMCQQGIAAIIIAKGGDYCFPVKGNQPSLLEGVKRIFENNPNCKTKKIRPEKGHGRLEERVYHFCTSIDGLDPEGNWAGLAAVGCLVKTVTDMVSNETHTSIQYFICSFTDMMKFIRVQRQHWGIESMHWALDVIYEEDACKVKKGFAPSNLNVLRKASLLIFNKAKEAASKKVSRIALMLRCNSNLLNFQKMLRGEPLS